MNDDFSADLSGTDFSSSDPADPAGADVSGADVSGADVSGADVSGADTAGAALAGAGFAGAGFADSVFALANHPAADLPGAAPAHPDLGAAGRPAGAAVHPSAIVDAGAVLGAGTRVWHFSHVCGGARIGAGCSLGQNVFIGNDVLVGANVKIQNNVSVYDAVTIEDDVFCGPSMVFTNVYNPRAAVIRKDQYRRTLVRRGATLGANATIVCGVTIGQYAFIGAGAVVTRDVPPFALMAGVPARQAGWMSRHGERLPLPVHANGKAACPHTGDVYTVRDGVCALEPGPAPAPC